MFGDYENLILLDTGKFTIKTPMESVWWEPTFLLMATCFGCVLKWQKCSGVCVEPLSQVLIRPIRALPLWLNSTRKIPLLQISPSPCTEFTKHDIRVTASILTHSTLNERLFFFSKHPSFFHRMKLKYLGGILNGKMLGGCSSASAAQKPVKAQNMRWQLSSLNPTLICQSNLSVFTGLVFTGLGLAHKPFSSIPALPVLGTPFVGFPLNFHSCSFSGF